MHIQRQTPMELVLQDGSRWMAVVFVPSAILIAFTSLEKHKPLGLLVTAFFLLFAAAFFRHTTFTFDKMQRLARWHRRTFLKVEIGSIPFDSIRDILVDAEASDSSSVSYRLTIVTTDGKTPMANMFQGGSIERYQHLRQQILDFLGLGSSLSAPEPGVLSNGIPSDIEPSLRALLAQGRTIDAIQLLRSRENLGLTEAKTRIDAMQKQVGTSAN